MGSAGNFMIQCSVDLFFINNIMLRVKLSFNKIAMNHALKVRKEKNWGDVFKLRTRFPVIN